MGATPRPWTNKHYYLDACVNDGSNPTWGPPKALPAGKCSWCGGSGGELVRAYTNPDGWTMHQHRFPHDDWHDIYGADGTKVTGNYDYEEGGVASSQEDSDLIVRAVNAHDALVTALQEALPTLESCEPPECPNEGDSVFWCERRTRAIDAARAALALAEERE